MSSVTRTVSEHLQALGLPTFPLADKPGVRMFILGLMIFASAVGIVVVKDVNRRLFNQYQSFQTSHEKKYETWGALLLEQSTLSAPARVERIAQDRLNMHRIDPKDVTVVELYD